MIRYNPKISEGLSNSQVEYRKEQGQVNYNCDVKTRTIGQIVFYNIFTLFNMLNLFLAILIFIVGEYKNLLFMGVVICNTLISIIQEIRSKKTIDKLSVISSIKTTVIRDFKEYKVNINEIVLDDIIKLKNGSQVVTDSVILEGDVTVDESFISGEENQIFKTVGDTLYSGSFIVGGNCICRVERVGNDNYISKITSEAKYIKKVNSVIMNTLKKVIKIVSIIIVPLGLVLFYKEYNLDHDISGAIVNTVAAIIAMIPEGLVLLTSTVLAVSVIRLSKKSILVQQLYCIETLARVDTLCIDKTGTLTEGILEVEDVIPLNNKYDYKKILSVLSNELKSDNETMKAIHRKFNIKTNYKVKLKENFTSSKKYSSVTFNKCKYIIGAPDILDSTVEMKHLINKYCEYRVLLLKTEHENIALILLKDKIRYKAKETLDYFKKYGVNVKIISGDSVNTVVTIAKRLGLSNINAIDMSINNTNYDKQLVEDYNIFCRVSPIQKNKLIKALKNNGHTVAMIGDGVNDVLALKESDCSIAMASGMDAARNVSELVILNSNFDSIPSVVEEGRRTINNIQRSATLFLSKTVYATLLAFIFIFIPMNYPFQPIQLSLVSSITIGIPAFVLALEPNYNIVDNNFFKNVIKRAIPSGITVVINVITVMILANIFNLSDKVISTLAVLLVAQTGFILLYKICYKFNKLRILLFISLIILFIGSIIGFKNLFELVVLKPILICVVIIIFMLDIILFNSLYKLFNYKILKG